MKIIKEIIRMLFIKKSFLCGVALLSILGLPFWGIGLGYPEPVFSVTSDNEPLNEVLAKITKSTGYKIEITKAWENKPLTVNIKKHALGKGLREIMRIAGGSNYALVINESMKTVEIRIIDDSSPGQRRGDGAYVGTQSDFRKREKAIFERRLVDIDHRRVVKPEEPQEPEITPPEIEVVHPDVDRMRHPD